MYSVLYNVYAWLCKIHLSSPITPLTSSGRPLSVGFEGGLSKEGLLYQSDLVNFKTLLCILRLWICLLVWYAAYCMSSTTGELYQLLVDDIP